MAYKRISPQPVDEGGTGASTLTDHGVVVGSGTSPLSVTAAGSSGQVLTANGGGSDPTFQAPAVDGPGSSTANALARWNGTGGDTLRNSTVIVSNNGEMINASQPAFLAYLNTQDNNVTGNGASFTLGSGNALTEVFDQNSDFVTTGTFTAPVTGKYLFVISITLLNITASTQGTSRIVTSNGTFQACAQNPNNVRGTGSGWQAYGSAFCDMDAADTATFTITATGEGGNTLDVSSTLAKTFVSGCLIC